MKGSFTGADASKKGIIESADAGTLFLDEIGETSPSMQVKLLRVLQERKVRPLGSTTDVPVDVRLIASTNRDLKALVAAGQFREDFFYRVSVIPIHVPPLRERREDVEMLARHFLRKYALQMAKPVWDFAPAALQALLHYNWPGNVRELENAVERAVAVSSVEDRVVRMERLPEVVSGTSVTDDRTLQGHAIEIPAEGVDFERRIAQVERSYLELALRIAGGVRTRAAEILHVSYRSFRHLAKKHGI